MLRDQLACLAQLAAVALALLQSVGEADLDPVAPLGALGALEKTLRRQAKISWALRLIAALRAKLTGDLQRVEQGEDPNLIFAAETAVRGVDADARADVQIEAKAEAAPRAERGERLTLERDRPETERFGRFVSRPADDEFAEILKRPTAEVIALIREALGLDDAEAGERGQGAAVDRRPGSRCDAPGAAPYHPPPGLGSSRGPPGKRPSLN